MIDPGEFDRRPKLARYPGEEALALYEKYLDGDEKAIDELMYYAKRFMILMTVRHFPRYTKESKEEVLSVSLSEFLVSVRNRRILRDQRSLHGYMRAIVLRVGKLHIRMHLWGKKRHKLNAQEFMRTYFARIPDAREIEADILVEELPLALRKQALNFSELVCPVKRGAVQYIVNRLLTKQRIVKEWLNSYYGISDPRWYVEHALVLVRRVMYDMQKDMLHFSTDSEKRKIIDEGMEAYLRGA